MSSFPSLAGDPSRGEFGQPERCCVRRLNFFCLVVRNEACSTTNGAPPARNVQLSPDVDRKWVIIRLQTRVIVLRFKRVPSATIMNAPSLSIVTTGNDVAGHEIVQYLGIVRGIIVRSTGIGRGFLGGLRSIGGRNIPEYVAVCEEARQHAFRLMLTHAAEVGAEAIIAFRYDATEFNPGSTEVLAYGTA
jgi:uncharacterized protein YbjQ (UPF0145 family)